VKKGANNGKENFDDETIACILDFYAIPQQSQLMW
jgi:hypothetical protein